MGLYKPQHLFATALIFFCYSSVGWTDNGKFQIQTLSSAPDYVSGGSVLVEVGPGAVGKQLTVSVNGLTARLACSICCRP